MPASHSPRYSGVAGALHNKRESRLLYSRSAHSFDISGLDVSHTLDCFWFNTADRATEIF